MNFDVFERTISDATFERPWEESRISDRVGREGVGSGNTITTKAVDGIEDRRILEAVERKILGSNSQTVFMGNNVRNSSVIGIPRPIPESRVDNVRL